MVSNEDGSIGWVKVSDTVWDTYDSASNQSLVLSKYYPDIIFKVEEDNTND